MVPALKGNGPLVLSFRHPILTTSLTPYGVLLRLVIDGQIVMQALLYATQPPEQRNDLRRLRNTATFSKVESSLRRPGRWEAAAHQAGLGP
jgi:hypothetical protein